MYGADTLFLAPEYMGRVNFISSGILGIATAVFIMSWNITTFILHSHRLRFLATTTKPFLKYCVNNSLLPIIFLLFYFFLAFEFETKSEFLPLAQFLFYVLGFIVGMCLLVTFSFVYFFTADKRINRSLTPFMLPNSRRKTLRNANTSINSGPGIKVGYYLSTRFEWKKTRDVSHYGKDFFDHVFRRHNLAAVVSISLAFFFLIVVGFFLDHKLFEVPAAASVLIFFSLLIAIIGTLGYFLQSWSILFIIGLFLLLNVLYHAGYIDPRNRAYGLDYSNQSDRPAYNHSSLQQLCKPEKVIADYQNMIGILNNWKSKQKQAKPLMVFLNVSGGGIRSASFVMDVLQRLDSITDHHIMPATFMISGASGGMFSATFFRELYREKLTNKNINLQDPVYRDQISGDLLNPIFSSMVSRDIFCPSQDFQRGKYHYVKDRGYAFERKLDQNTKGVLNKPIGFYADDEKNANIPLMIFNSVVTSDGRKMMLSTQPLSFLMQSNFIDADSSTLEVDAIDFAAMFKKQDPLNVDMLTALRMNATFPYVLPNVWLPTVPVVDVMDAGVRANYGQDTTLRFLNVFKDWIKLNTSGIVLLQIRDRPRDGWETSNETPGIQGFLTTPATIFQNNWYKLQDYFQNDQITYAKSFIDSNFKRITFIYLPEKPDKRVPLSMHITASERKEVLLSLDRINNLKSFKEVAQYFK
ncbi:MAG: hypothetical protein NVS3B19_15490 [Ginsengibacter sp.]